MPEPEREYPMRVPMQPKRKRDVKINVLAEENTMPDPTDREAEWKRDTRHWDKGT